MQWVTLICLAHHVHLGMFLLYVVDVACSNLGFDHGYSLRDVAFRIRMLDNFMMDRVACSESDDFLISCQHQIPHSRNQHRDNVALACFNEQSKLLTSMSFINM